jgi:hypothetical protein
MTQFYVLNIANVLLALPLCILEVSGEVVPMPTYASWHVDIWMNGDDSILS